jgi:hypothetical protein
MWPRVTEIVIGLWLLTSPWLLASNSAVGAWHFNGLLCGSTIVLLGGLSFRSRWRKAHLAEIPIGVWILSCAYLDSTHPAPPVVQSGVLTALFLLNFAIIPSQANLPPISWQRFRADSSSQRRAPNAVNNVTAMS